MQICLPMEIKQKSDENSDIDTDLITVKNFYCSLDKRNKCDKIWEQQTANGNIFSLLILPISRRNVKTFT